MQPELEALLAVQAKDNEILDAARKITHQQDRADLVNKQLEQSTRRNNDLHEELENKRIEGRKLSEEVDHLDDHIREQERKLANDIVSYKEIDVIKESIAHGHQHIDDLEEKALAMLDDIETEAETVKEKDAKFAEKKATLESDFGQISTGIENERASRAQLQTERETLWNELPEHLKTTYSKLSKSMDDPLAAVAGPNCGGCHLQLSTQVIQAVRTGSSLVHCEHCSRILYIP
jgi:hypothetical protein